MEVIYRLPAKPDVDLPVRFGTAPIKIDDAEVRWEISSGGKLNTVVLRFPGQTLRFDNRGVILSTFPELESRAYRLSTYVANRLYQQTSFDAIDPETVLSVTPELYAESLHEEGVLANHLRTVHSSRSVKWAIRRTFEPSDYPALFRHSAALALYTDGLRVKSPFQKYELFYKVIEYFFPKQGRALDSAVSAYAQQYDPRFSASQIETLRLLRNRVIHPHARNEHVNPETLEAIYEVRDNLRLLQVLASLLFQHPPF